MAEPAIAFASASGADWSGRDLAGASVRFCDLSGLRLPGAAAAGSFWQHCALRRADLTAADLSRATFVDCDLTEVDLTDGCLSGARLMRCSLEGARLTGASLDDAATVGCTLARAELTGVRDAASARDLVVEVLRRRAGEDAELMRWVGLVALQRSWCYDEFAAALDAHPRLREIALDAFRKLPESGFAEALAAARLTV